MFFGYCRLVSSRPTIAHAWVGVIAIGLAEGSTVSHWGVCCGGSSNFWGVVVKGLGVENLVGFGEKGLGFWEGKVGGEGGVLAQGPGFEVDVVGALGGVDGG